MAVDLETQHGESPKHVTEGSDAQQHPAAGRNVKDVLRTVILAGRVEEGGIEPIPTEARTATNYYNAFTIWCSINTNILA